MLKIRYISQMRRHVTHDTNNGICDLVALISILNAQCTINHFLKVPSVFWNN